NRSGCFRADSQAIRGRKSRRRLAEISRSRPVDRNQHSENSSGHTRFGASQAHSRSWLRRRIFPLHSPTAGSFWTRSRYGPFIHVPGSYASARGPPYGPANRSFSAVARFWTKI